MNFANLFRNLDKEHGSNLSHKIGNSPKLSTSDYFCMWSDLLGFGDVFFENNWDISTKQQKNIYKRLQAAHSAVLYYSSPFSERNLILNDGIAKVYKINSGCLNAYKTKIQDISLFIRSAVQLHLAISNAEICEEYPGCRTVLAFGKGIEYLTDEVRFDDYVMNYTKQKGSDVSNLAKENGNPIIIYNPKELQMNTAFSKAYILESKGSSIGISGNGFYIDQSAIDSICKISSRDGFECVFKDIEEGLYLSIPYNSKNSKKVVLGFLFHKDIINVQIKNWETKVYKILKFYPHDEDTDIFNFDLVNVVSNFEQ